MKIAFPYKTREQFKQILVNVPDGMYSGQLFEIIEDPEISQFDRKILQPILHLKPFVKLKGLYGIFFPKEWLNIDI